jgi:uncharacterized ferritin-like protein (DUF455 family)
MLAHSFSNPLLAVSPQETVQGLHLWVTEVLARKIGAEIPETPGRNAQVVPIRALAPRPGFFSVEGQSPLLHDLANIELQAMELAFRTLVEFGTRDAQFAAELAQITEDEGKHFLMCCKGLETLGRLISRMPVRKERIACELRIQAGFSEGELEVLEAIQRKEVRV